MSIRKNLARLVLVLGAGASIATSRMQEPLWRISDPTPLLTHVLDDQLSTSRHAIQAVLRSRSRLDGLVGDATVRIDLRARDVSGVRPTELLIVLSTPDGLVDREVVALAPGESRVVELLLPLWTDCESDLCVEDLDLSVTRTNLADDPVVDVSGTVEADASGLGGTPPVGTTITVDATSLGPIQ